MRYSEEERELVISEWKASGLSRTAFARANRLNPQTLQNWTRERERPLVEIPASTAAVALASPEIIVEKGAIRVRLPGELGAKLLPVALRVLGEAS
jgi:transposase-like protein